MTTRAEVVAEARSWLATPYRHHGRLKGVGADCIGLLIGVSRSLNLREPTFDVTGYPRSPSGDTLRGGCARYLTPLRVEDIQPGDVLLLRFETQPQHLAFVGDDGKGGLTMIHAYSGGRAAVVEHRIAPVWRARIVAAYSMPGVA